MSLLNFFHGRRQSLQDSSDFADDIIYPVHLQDANYAKLLMACTMRFDCVLDSEKLHAGLTRLLEIGDWRKVGGRLRRNVSKIDVASEYPIRKALLLRNTSQADGKLEIHVPAEYSPKRPAVTFSLRDLHTMPIRDHDLASKLPTPTKETSIQPTPYDLIDLAIREDMPKTIKELVDSDMPQLSLHVVSFQDATLVSLAWPHSVMGAQGFCDLVHAWSLVISGRESDVPPFLGAKDDVLLEAENGEAVSNQEEQVVEQDRLTGLGLLAFILRLIWNMRKPREVKSIFIPKQAVQKLQADCQDEMAQTSDLGVGKTQLVDGTTILAWFTRLAASASSDSKPVSVISMSNAARSISSLRPKIGVNIHNMTTYVFSFLPGKTARGGLGPLVQEHKRQGQQQMTEGQCLGFLRTYRRATQDGGSFRPMYGPSNAQPVVCNDMTIAGPIRSADFGAALLEKPEMAGPGSPGAMTCIYYHIIGNKLGAGLDCIYLLGKDYGENLWVAASLPAEAWSRVEAALKRY
ncbi:hypothetical protein PWT90_04495 [Aphanocladium album]|nr:hypothetical protein PWT90_04495 [Aphanocladium album]